MNGSLQTLQFLSCRIPQFLFLAFGEFAVPLQGVFYAAKNFRLVFDTVFQPQKFCYCCSFGVEFFFEFPDDRKDFCGVTDCAVGFGAVSNRDDLRAGYQTSFGFRAGVRTDIGYRGRFYYGVSGFF